MARRKKQAKQAKAPSHSPISTGIIAPVDPVALLIDGENVVLPDLIAHILVEAGKCSSL